MSNRTCAWIGVASLGAMFAGCQAGHSMGGGSSGPVSVRLDGAIDEWPADAACVGDGDYVYFRISVQDEQFTLQHADRTLALYLDLDCNLETGVAAEAPAAAARGADLVIEFSPRKGAEGTGQGVGVFAVDRTGARRVVRHADVGLSFSPSYAAPWYEVRISRHPAPASGLSPTLTASDNVVRGVVVLFDRAGAVDKWSDPFEGVLPAIGPGGPKGEEIPARPAGALRVVTWNIERSAPVDHPDAFARVLKALEPDVVLVQEWDKGDAAALQAWFTAFVPSSGGWQALKSPDGDVGVVAQYPLRSAGPAEVRVAGDGRPVRFVGAVMNTPGGDVFLGTTHLKCCGFKDSEEDVRRVGEARAINESLKAARGLPALRVLGGDLNLVGSRPPLDLLRAGLDPDGTDLSVAEPAVLGDAAFYTWSDAATEFTPGRLDFVVWSGSSAKAANQFVLDTSRLTARALQRAGLRAEDTAASDHLPVVVDFVRAGAGRVTTADDGAGESAE